MSMGEYVDDGATHYATRKTRSARHGCRRGVGKPTCGGAFKCARCKKLVGWCLGGLEGSVRDDWCNACWCKDEASKNAEGKR